MEKMIQRKWPVITIVFVIVGAMIMGWQMYEHELIHQYIWEDYGIKSQIDLNFLNPKHFGAATTTAESPCPTKECQMLQMQNEIAGYNASSINQMLFLGLFAIVFVLEMLFILYYNSLAVHIHDPGFIARPKQAKVSVR